MRTYSQSSKEMLGHRERADGPERSTVGLEGPLRGPSEGPLSHRVMSSSQRMVESRRRHTLSATARGRRRVPRRLLHRHALRCRGTSWSLVSRHATKSHRGDSNPQPAVYKTAALPN
jgi:hypothetical protein